MTGKYATAAEQAIARATLDYPADYVEHAAQIAAARMLRAFAEILDTETTAAAVPEEFATRLRELREEDEAFAARLREIVRRRGGNVEAAFGTSR